MSATLTMNPAIHRKPLPGRAPPSQQAYNAQPPPQQQAQYPPQQQQQYSRQNTMASTASSSIDNRASSIYSFAPSVAPTQQTQYGSQQTRRTLSNATGSSTSSSATNTGLQRAPTNSSNGPRRSTSSRSTTSVSPTSYVALMRKQKATVWCDRAQAEDPRILAAQRAAKMRATMEVAGGSHRVSTSGNSQQGSVGIRSKIRHHGAPKAGTYTGNYMGGAGVPMRLSATEVDDGNDSDEEDSRYMNYHRRNGSGRSSLGSRNNSYLNSRPGGLSNGNNSPNGHSPGGGMGDLREEVTPTPNDLGGSDYFQQSGGSAGTPGSLEDERKFGGLGGLPQRELTVEEQIKEQTKRNDDLRRRGSVDDRTMTMSAGRLFVANPDASDSD